MNGARSIELGEALPDWAAAEDQEGVMWLTCKGLPVLNLTSVLRRAADEGLGDPEERVRMSILEEQEEDALNVGWPGRRP